MRFDVIILGAGIVGVSTALHLQLRGLDVALLDRARPGLGASFGNAGLIERSSVIPASFPRNSTQLFKYASNLVPSVRIDPLYLLKSAPAFFHYWRNSSRSRLKFAVDAMLPLMEASIDEHDALAGPANAFELMSSGGWIGIWRTPERFATISTSVSSLDRFNLTYTVLDENQLARVETKIRTGPGAAIGGIHWRDAKTVSDPGELVSRYAKLFAQRGGCLVTCDATNLRRSHGAWQVNAPEGEIRARHVVVALGPQSAMFARQFGLSFPIIMKRGYHRHYAMREGMPTHPIADQEAGFVMSPMSRGLRITTGVEFADVEAAPNYSQIRNAEAAAADLLPLGQAVEETPWLGVRPCMPDMKPVIGPAPGKEGVWFNFGHGHNGLTLGPVTGRLLAEMMTGENTFADVKPFRPSRFS
jgi:D-amino-acid dehydrogenase